MADIGDGVYYHGSIEDAHGLYVVHNRRHRGLGSRIGAYCLRNTNQGWLTQVHEESFEVILPAVEHGAILRELS